MSTTDKIERVVSRFSQGLFMKLTLTRDYCRLVEKYNQSAAPALDLRAKRFKHEARQKVALLVVSFQNRLEFDFRKAELLSHHDDEIHFSF